MTFWGTAHHLSRLLTLDANEWKLFPYWLDLKRRGIDVRFAGVEELGLSRERSKEHSQSGGPDLEAVLDAMAVSRDDSILDIGCGKGGAMLTMARFPFSRIDGVEISPQLAHIARQNFVRAGLVNSRVFCSDAAEFTGFGRYNMFYMYNPFPSQVMEKVVHHISGCVLPDAVPVRLIYRHPVYRRLVDKAGFVKMHEFHFHVMKFRRAMRRTAPSKCMKHRAEP